MPHWQIWGQSLQKNWENNYCTPSPFGDSGATLDNSIRNLEWGGISSYLGWLAPELRKPRNFRKPKEIVGHFSGMSRRLWECFNLYLGRRQEIFIGFSDLNHWNQRIWHLNHPKSGDSSERLQAVFIRFSEFLSVIPCHETLGSYSQVSKSRIWNLPNISTPQQKLTPTNQLVVLASSSLHHTNHPALVPSAQASRQTFLQTHALMHRNLWGPIQKL